MDTQFANQLNRYIGHRVEVRVVNAAAKSGEVTYWGTLLSFDINLNLILSGAERSDGLLNDCESLVISGNRLVHIELYSE